MAAAPRLFSLSLLLLFLLVAIGASAKLQDDRVLVIVDEDSNIKQSHSIFFDDLKARGFKLTFAEADASDLSLQKHGEWLYGHVVLFAPAINGFGGGIEKGALIDFIDSGRNVLVAADSSIGAIVDLLASECGVKFDDDRTAVIDHFNYDAADEGDHTLIDADRFNERANVIYGSYNCTGLRMSRQSEAALLIDSGLIGGKPSKYGPVLFRGVGQVLDDEANPLLYPILTAPHTAYSFNPNEQIKGRPHAVGQDLVLVSAFQGKNNARAVFSGSLDLFSNKFFSSSVQPAIDGKKAARSSNRDFARDITEWTFKERGVLRASNVRHHRPNEAEPPKFYRIKDPVEYHVDIFEMKNGEWVPFKANDVQLEFVRLDPHVRINLKHDNKGHYRTNFTIPDVYGIFTFHLDYQRLGYTFIDERTVHPVRPFRHDEYERFIVAAYPYYAGAFSMIAGLFVFSIAFLFTKEYVPSTKVKKS